MESPDPKARAERDETDASLLAERTRSDDEHAKTRTSIDEEADLVIEVARERAEATLRAARERADRELAAAGANTQTMKALTVERAHEDGAVASEHAAADEQVLNEREQRRQALSALLRLERDATDDGLLLERTVADSAVASRDDFLGMVSHDLRSMLGGIALSASLLAADASAPALRQTDRIKRFTARMNHLLGDLLDVVSLEAGELHIKPHPDDAAALVRDAVEAYAESFATRDIVLVAELGATSIPATFDHERILQVISNLLSNALKFAGSGQRVSLGVARDGSGVRFSVTDSGPGIPEGKAAAIFERFQQVAVGDRRGLGLGLYIAKSIVEAHGGSIGVETPAAGGASFHFTLPA